MKKQLDGIEKCILCARFYERIKSFYENPANQQRFENMGKNNKKQFLNEGEKQNA